MDHEHPNSLLVRRYWAAASARDWAAFATYLDPQIVYRVPQTREIVRGREAYVEFNASYPGDWTAELMSVVGEGGQAVSRLNFSVGGETATGLSFFELRDGLIAAIDDFWPEPYNPPPRMTAVVERY
jgi:ketosteroid isomerase-like protein